MELICGNCSTPRLRVNLQKPAVRVFCRVSSLSWLDNVELNKMFLKSNENYANHLLLSRGHVFLNEVYDMLGLSRTDYGQICGWVHPGGINNQSKYISFGFGDFETVADNSYELVFNIDGVIYDRIDY